MTEIIGLTFEDTQYPVTVTLTSNQVYQAVRIDWSPLRKDWAAPTGVMLEVLDPTNGAPIGQRLRVFVPWNSIRYITQVYPPIPTEGLR